MRILAVAEKVLVMRNETLHRKVEKFIIASVTLLKGFASKESVSRIRIGTSKEDSKIDSFAFVFQHFKDLEKLPEFIDCAKYLRQNPVTLKAINRGWRDKDGNLIKEEDLRKKLPLKLDFFRDLHYLLSRHIQENNDFVFSRNKFDRIYKKFERGVYSKNIRYRLTSLLEGFTGDIEELNLGNNFRIRKMTEEEKRSVLDEFPPPTPFSVLDMIGHEYVLEVTLSQAKGTTPNVNLVQEVFDDIVTVLRLFKSGCVTARGIKCEPISWSFFGRSFYGKDFRSGIVPPGIYKLNKSEMRSILKLWRRFRTFRRNKGFSEDANYFNIALKRFNFGIEGNDAESKIIDFVIAFEALCLPKSGEHRYKFSNRVAILLAKNSGDAEKIREFMKKAYDVRSLVVHGGRSKPIVIDRKIIDLKTFTPKLEEYLRMMLRAFLALSTKGKKRNDIIALLEKSLFDLKTKRLLHSLSTPYNQPV
jgi:hypothetical protein